MNENEYSVELRNASKPHKNPHHIILPISLGQPYHEGSKFISAMAYANHRYLKISVLLADYLQRHNSLSIDVINQMSEKWRLQHKRYFGAAKLIRWSPILSDHRYLRCKKNVLDYLAGPGKDLIEKDLERAAKRSLGSRDGCLAYIIEEIAVVSVVLNDINNASLLYPGSYPQSLIGFFDYYNSDLFKVGFKTIKFRRK